MPTERRHRWGAREGREIERDKGRRSTKRERKVDRRTRQIVGAKRARERECRAEAKKKRACFRTLVLNAVWEEQLQCNLE